MKKLLLILALSLGTYFGWEHQDKLPELLGTFKQPEPANFVNKPLRTQSWKWLYRENKQFNELSIGGSYTVIFITSPNCVECSEIQANLNDFIKERRDVAIYRMNIQTNPQTVNNDNAKVLEHEKRYLTGLFEAYDVDKTPHVEIYDPSGKLLASDRGDSDRGYKFLSRWIETETKSKR